MCARNNLDQCCRFDTIGLYRRVGRHTTTVNTRASIASRRKNQLTAVFAMSVIWLVPNLAWTVANCRVSSRRRRQSEFGIKRATVSRSRGSCNIRRVWCVAIVAYNLSIWADARRHAGRRHLAAVGAVSAAAVLHSRFNGAKRLTTIYCTFFRPNVRLAARRLPACRWLVVCLPICCLCAVLTRTHNIILDYSLTVNVIYRQKQQSVCLSVGFTAVRSS